MRFNLSFSMDNAPFDGGDNSVDEVVRILRHLADRLDAYGAHGVDLTGNVHDVNGNLIGSWDVTDQDGPWSPANAYAVALCLCDAILPCPVHDRLTEFKEVWEVTDDE